MREDAQESRATIKGGGRARRAHARTVFEVGFERSNATRRDIDKPRAAKSCGSCGAELRRSRAVLRGKALRIATCTAELLLLLLLLLVASSSKTSGSGSKKLLIRFQAPGRISIGHRSDASNFSKIV
jgi:hypothetical protein